MQFLSERKVDEDEIDINSIRSDKFDNEPSLKCKKQRKSFYG